MTEWAVTVALTIEAETAEEAEQIAKARLEALKDLDATVQDVDEA